MRRSWRDLALALTAVVLVGAAYYVVTRVVTVERIRQQVARLPRPSLVALLPPATPTFTAVPTQPTPMRPSPTRIPTATREPSVTPTASLTPTLAASPTPSAVIGGRATATPAYPYPAVVLLAPPHQAEVSGPEAPLNLSWQPVGTLAEDEWYGVSLRYWADERTQYTGAWVKETTWRVPQDLFRKPDPARPAFEWDVRVMKKTGTRPDGGSEGVPLSPPGETRTFIWR